MKPILFNTEMVRAILDGTKTMTRRPIKPQPIGTRALGICTSTTGDKRDIGKVLFDNGESGISDKIKPPCQVGDILYVREAWQNVCVAPPHYAYKADYACEKTMPIEYVGMWRPSIHMPKEVARIFLRVTALKVERVQDISDSDIRLEGFPYRCVGLSNCGCCDDSCPTNFPKEWFEDLWISVYGKESWERNDWVWAYTLERIDKSEVRG